MSWGDDVRDVGDNGTRAHPLAGLLAIATKLDTDERAVLQLVAERLLTGQHRYGRFDVATDRRDFRHEAVEEVADALVCAAAALLRGRG
jgi:hypothetical protein